MNRNIEKVVFLKRAVKVFMKGERGRRMMTHSFADTMSESSFLVVTMQTYKDR